MSLFDDDLAEDMKDPEYRREHVASVITVAMMQQLGDSAIDIEGRVHIPPDTMGDFATIDCYNLADAVLRALDGA